MSNCIRCNLPIDEVFVSEVALARKARGMEVKRPKVCAECLLEAISNMEDIDTDGEIGNGGQS